MIQINKVIDKKIPEFHIKSRSKCTKNIIFLIALKMHLDINLTLSFYLLLQRIYNLNNLFRHDTNRRRVRHLKINRKTGKKTASSSKLNSNNN